MYVVGVDGCKAGWIAVALSEGRFAGAACFKDFGELVESVPDAVAIGVDIPIGLLPESLRVCDALARTLVGARRSSVFLMPPRRALEAETYDEANSLCRMLTDKGVSKQAYSLRAKIFEVERALVAIAAAEEEADSLPVMSKPGRHPARVLAEKKETKESLRRYARIIEPDGGRRARRADQLPGGRIVEVHPEASFREMAGDVLEHSKKSYNGMTLRMRLLAEQDVIVPSGLDQIGGVTVDDVLDAAAVAWSTNRYAHRKAKSLPPRELWQYDGDRALAIWV